MLALTLNEVPLTATSVRQGFQKENRVQTSVDAAQAVYISAAVAR